MNLPALFHYSSVMLNSSESTATSWAKQDSTYGPFPDLLDAFSNLTLRPISLRASKTFLTKQA